MIVGDITSSNRYKSLNEGKAIAINTKAGVIVQINSINVQWLEYLYTIGEFLWLKLIIILNNIQNTPIEITIK